MDTVTDCFTAADKERFNNLLQLAARTPFPGERDNAIAAAERLAARHGMTMAEAAAHDGMPRAAEPPPPPVDPFWAGIVRSAHLTEAFIAADKRRREEALHRSEEHTSELQSRMRISYAVFCLKKKKQQKYQ